MRETILLSSTYGDSRPSEMDLIIKEFNICMKNYLNTEIPIDNQGAQIITHEVKFMMLKIESLCKRLTNQSCHYKHRFRKELM